MTNVKGILNRLCKLEELLGDDELLGGVDMCRTIDELNGKFNWLEPEVFARGREDRKIGKELEGLQRVTVRQREKIDELEEQVQVLKGQWTSASPRWMERVEQLEALVARCDVLEGEKQELAVRVGCLEKEKNGHAERIKRLERRADKRMANIGLPVPEVATSKHADLVDESRQAASKQPDRVPAPPPRSNAQPSAAGRPPASVKQAYATPFTSLIESVSVLTARVDRREHADDQQWNSVRAHIGQLQNANTAHVTVTQTVNGRLEQIHNRTVLLEKKAGQLAESVLKCSDQLEEESKASLAAECNERIDALTACFDESERSRKCLEDVNEKRLETLIGDNAQMTERTKRIEAAQKDQQLGLPERMNEELDAVKKQLEILAATVGDNNLDIQQMKTSVESLDKRIDVSSEDCQERAKQECQVLEQRLHERLHKAEKYLKSLKHKGEAEVTRVDGLAARIEAQRQEESGRWANLAAHIGSQSVAEEAQSDGPSSRIVPQRQAESEGVDDLFTRVASPDVAAASRPTTEAVTHPDREIPDPEFVDEASEADDMRTSTTRITRATTSHHRTPVTEAMDTVASRDSEHASPPYSRPTRREREMKSLKDSLGWTQAIERMRTVDTEMADADVTDASEGPRRSAREPKPVELPGDMLDWHAARERMKGQRSEADVRSRERPRKIIAHAPRKAVTSCKTTRDKSTRGKVPRPRRCTEKRKCGKGSG